MNMISYPKHRVQLCRTAATFARFKGVLTIFLPRKVAAKYAARTDPTRRTGEGRDISLPLEELEEMLMATVKREVH